MAFAFVVFGAIFGWAQTTSASATEAQGDAALRGGEPSKALGLFLSEWRLGNRSVRLRGKILQAAARLDSLPPLPSEARRLSDRASGRFRLAPVGSDHTQSISEFERAIDIAPWAGHLYFNLALVQEAAQEFAAAADSFDAYLIAQPQSDDRRMVEAKIEELRLRAEAARRQKEIASLFGRRWRSLKPIEQNGQMRTSNRFWIEIDLSSNHTAQIRIEVPGDKTYNFDGIFKNGKITAEFVGPKHDVDEQGTMVLRTVGDMIEAKFDFKSRYHRYSYFDYLGR